MIRGIRRMSSCDQVRHERKRTLSLPVRNLGPPETHPWLIVLFMHLIEIAAPVLNSNIVGNSRPKESGQPMPGMDHSAMPGMDHGSMPGMTHGPAPVAAPAQGAPAPSAAPSPAAIRQRPT